jgi:hypothetical protein
MNRTIVFAASSAVILLSMSPSFGAPRSKTSAVSPLGPEQTLQEIDALAIQVRDGADKLASIVRTQAGTESQVAQLNDIKEEVNRIGRDLRTLEDERGSLAPWEVKALGQIEPLLVTVAQNANQAIRTFNSERQHLWATSYFDNAQTVSKDAKQVAALLRDYLTLSKDRQEEMRLEQRLGDLPTN